MTEYTIIFAATVQIRARVEAGSLAEAEAFAAAVMDGSTLTTTDEDLRDAIDADSLDLTAVIDITEDL